MDGVRDIATLGIPFTLGVAAGTVLPMPAGAAAAVFCLLSAALMKPAGLRIRWALLFLSLGLLCCLMHGCLPASGQGNVPVARRSCEALKGIIDGIPFRHNWTGPLIKALLTGDKSALGKDTVAVFRNSGASHLLALSGLHLGFIYLIIRRLLGIFGNTPPALRIRCAVTIAATFFYTLMTGAGPSIVRAFIYICIREAARLDPGRKANPPRILLASLTIQLCLEPQVLSQLGFQLSYLAMAGLATVFPRLQDWFPKAESRDDLRDPVRKIWNIAAVSLSCQLFTAPLVWIRFRSFPKYFLLTNLLALPLCSAAMGVSVAVICLWIMGICPEALLRLDDTLVWCLVKTLEVVSSM